MIVIALSSAPIHSPNGMQTRHTPSPIKTATVLSDYAFRAGSLHGESRIVLL